jgi:hypothetical protein
VKKRAYQDRFEQYLPQLNVNEREKGRRRKMTIERIDKRKCK